MDTKKNAILITGATGKQGGAIARELLAKGYKVRAMTRHPEGAEGKALAALGAEVVAGDFDDAASLERALAGMWGAFSVQNSWETGVEREVVQGERFAKLAREKGVQHFVYSSVGSANRKTGIPHFDSKWQIEETVRGLAFPSYTILRPVFFMENLASPMFLPAIQQGQLPVGIEPTTKLQMIAVEDIGRYGLWAFEHHAEANRREIEIAGDALTMPQTADILARVSSRPVTFLRVPIAEVRKFSDDFATMLEWFDAVGYIADIDKNAKETGVRPTTFADWAAKTTWAAPAAAR